MSQKVEYPQDLAPLFDKYEMLRVYPPEEPRPNQQWVISRIDEAIWELQIKNCVKRLLKLEQSLTVVFNVSIGQCRLDITARIESHTR